MPADQSSTQSERRCEQCGDTGAIVIEGGAMTCPDVPKPWHKAVVRHVCGGSEGCMCMYDPELNLRLRVGPTLVPLDKIVEALEDYYAPQARRTMHPADFITKKFEMPGHEGLEYA